MCFNVFVDPRYPMLASGPVLVEQRLEPDAAIELRHRLDVATDGG
jgi:hypothetical protein